MGIPFLESFQPGDLGTRVFNLSPSSPSRLSFLSSGKTSPTLQSSGFSVLGLGLKNLVSGTTSSLASKPVIMAAGFNPQVLEDLKAVYTSLFALSMALRDSAPFLASQLMQARENLHVILNHPGKFDLGKLESIAGQKLDYRWSYQLKETVIRREQIFTQAFQRGLKPPDSAMRGLAAFVERVDGTFLKLRNNLIALSQETAAATAAAFQRARPVLTRVSETAPNAAEGRLLSFIIRRPLLAGGVVLVAVSLVAVGVWWWMQHEEAEKLQPDVRAQNRDQK